MDGHITGQYFKIVKRTFTETAGDAAVARVVRDLGIPLDMNDNNLYSVIDYNKLMDAGIERFWPKLSNEQGLFRLGESIFSGFTETTIGQVAMRLSVSHPKKLAARTPSHYECFIDWGKVTYEDIDEKTYALRFEGFKTSPHYDHGIMVAGTKPVAPECDIVLNIDRFDNPAHGVIDADFEVRFTLP